MTTFEDIAYLKKNWDGYGAKPINQEIIARAKEFYEESGINPNFMAPTARGTIQFECTNNINYVEIEIYLHSFDLYIADKNDNWSYEGHFYYKDEDYKRVRKIIDFFLTI